MHARFSGVAASSQTAMHDSFSTIAEVWGKGKEPTPKTTFFLKVFCTPHYIGACCSAWTGVTSSFITDVTCVATTGTVRTWLSVLLFSLSTDYRAFHKGKAKSLLY